jgi:hypothetical protein
MFKTFTKSGVSFQIKNRNDIFVFHDIIKIVSISRYNFSEFFFMSGVIDVNVAFVF